MEKEMLQYVNRLKSLLRNEEELGERDLLDEVQLLHEDYERTLEMAERTGQFEAEGEKEFDGLFIKFKRLHEFEPALYDRDSNSGLACQLDFGFDFYQKECPFSEDELAGIQKSITVFMAKRAKENPCESDPEFAETLLTGVPRYKLDGDDLMNIVGNLTRLTHDFVDYISAYKPESWYWTIDCIVISQYIFEKMVELTYRKAMGENLDDYYYDIREAFTYYETNIPVQLQMQVNESVQLLEDVVYDTINYIDSKDFYTCDYEVWLRPIFFNIGVDAIEFTLEQDNY